MKPSSADVLSVHTIRSGLSRAALLWLIPVVLATGCAPATPSGESTPATSTGGSPVAEAADGGSAADGGAACHPQCSDPCSLSQGCSQEQNYSSDAGGYALVICPGYPDGCGGVCPSAPPPDESPGPASAGPPLVAIARGVNVHAGVLVPVGDRTALERLVRYLLRPPLSLRRLSLRDDGAVVYRLQRPDRKGRTALILTPLEVLARLAAIVPAPRLALRRQLGVFSPGSRDRRKIMPPPAPPKSCHQTPKAPTRIPWAELLRRVFDLDGLRCERCGGRMQPVALILDPAEAERYLRHTGEFTPLPAPARSRGPPAAVA